MGLLREAVMWWAARMAESLPAAMRGALPGTADALLAAPDAAGHLSFTLRRRGRPRVLGTLPVDAGLPVALTALLPAGTPAATLLVLPETWLLQRDVVLPLAAEADLERVLAYEMDRLTPFAAADLHWTYAVTSRDRASADLPGRLRLRLSVVLRRSLATPVAALAAANRAPQALVVPQPGGLCHIPLSREDEARRRHKGRRALAVMAAACSLLGLVAAGVPLLRPWQALNAAEARIATLRAPLAEVEALRRRIAGQVSGTDLLLAEVARSGSALGAVATLTELLPDTTYLTAMTLRQRRLTLTGQSADAARLIPLLAADPALREPVFLAPVTRTERSGDRPAGEAFSIRVDLGS